MPTWAAMSAELVVHDLSVTLGGVPILEDVSLPADVAQRRLGELPTGVQKLVDLARAILAGPSVLLLDEPTSGVSVEERQLVRRALDDLRTEGRTIMVIDHDPGFVAACCDRVACM